MCALIFQDSKLQLLAMAFRQAEVLAFTNGVAKSVASRLVDVLLTYLVCPNHKVSVYWQAKQLGAWFCPLFYASTLLEWWLLWEAR